MHETAIRASEAARRLDISTKQLLALIHSNQIDYVMQDGIAHLTESAIEQYRASAP